MTAAKPTLQPAPAVTIHCATCGSENVRRDASAEWNAELQMWEIVTVFDVADCEDCGTETSLIEKQIGGDAP